MRDNMFRTPESSLSDPNGNKVVLASRLERFIAYFFDGMIVVMFFAAVFLIIGGELGPVPENQAAVEEKVVVDEPPVADMASMNGDAAAVEPQLTLLINGKPLSVGYRILIAILTTIFYCAINIKFVLESGQTLGKKALKIKVVTLNGDLPLPEQFARRYGFTLLLPMIPIVGFWIDLSDAVRIFWSDRRCLHDLVAGTMVVKAT